MREALNKLSSAEPKPSAVRSCRFNQSFLRKWVGLCWLALGAALLPLSADAEAELLPGLELVTYNSGFGSLDKLFDGNAQSGTAAGENACLTLERQEGIGSLYLTFDYESPNYTLTDNQTERTVSLGEKGFAHDFISLEDVFGHPVASVTIRFPKEQVKLWEVQAFAPGEPPEWVQRWRPCWEEGADLALFSTHGDDEQIFFAGLLPEYAGERGYRVQVIYLTNHRNMTGVRVHEMLNGLWAVGVRAYPVFGDFDDFLTYDREEAFRIFERLGWPKETLLGFVVEQLRRFRPLVAVGHDFAGEYGHGQHMAYAQLLAEAVERSGDEAQFPESAQRWGAWEVPKTYFHLYGEHPVVLNWDQPLECFGGLTAFEVTKLRGFPCHETQQYPVFCRQLYPFDRAAEVERYSPCRYGLYRTQVGEDEACDDFFEHLICYDQQRKLTEQLQQLLQVLKS